MPAPVEMRKKMNEEPDEASLFYTASDVQFTDPRRALRIPTDPKQKFVTFNLSNISLCVGVLLLGTFALLLVAALIFPVLSNSASSVPEPNSKEVVSEGGKGKHLSERESAKSSTSAPRSTTTIAPDCVGRVCLSEATYFKVKPAGLFSWQIPPCSDFYGFVCTEDMLNQSYPGWRPFKQASVGFLYRTALHYIDETVDFLGDVDTAISQVSLFVRNCSRQQDREANQKDALLNVLTSVGLGGFPYLEGDEAASVRLDDVVAAALRLLDVAPFFRVRVVNDKAGFGNAILLTPHTPVLPTLELLQLSKQFDHLLKTWWTLRDLLPILQSQSSADIEALLNIFRDLTRISSTRVNISAKPALAKVKDLPKFHHWNWRRSLNALFENITTFSDQSPVTMSDREYFAELARVLDQYESRHLMNFVGLSIADSHVTFLSAKYTKVKDFAHVPYHDTSLPLREQLCLRFAERICPMGVEALLLQALARSSVREDLIKEFTWWIPDFKAIMANYSSKLAWLDAARRKQVQELVAEMKIKILFSDLLYNTSVDLKTIDCGYPFNLYTKHPLQHYAEAYKHRLREYLESFKSDRPPQRYPPSSSFDYNIVYDNDANAFFVPISYFGLSLQATPLLRKYYVVKVLPDLVRAVTKVLAKKRNKNNNHNRYKQMLNCILSIYETQSIPFLYQKIQREEFSVLNDIVANHLALDPYMTLFLNITRSLTGDDRLTIRGFSPYLSKHVAMFFFVESSCEPYKNHCAAHQDQGLSPMTRTNGAISQYPPFSVLFSCRNGSPMTKDPCVLYLANKSRRH